MIKHLRAVLSLFLLFIIVAYLIGAVILWNLDLSTWTTNDRTILTLIPVCAAILARIFYCIEKSDI